MVIPILLKIGMVNITDKIFNEINFFLIIIYIILQFKTIF